MRVRNCWLGLLISLSAGLTAAQEKLDFTGQWVLVTPRDAGDAARGLSVRQWFEHTTSVRGLPTDIPHVAIERQFQDGVRSESYQIGIVGGILGWFGPGRQRSKLEYPLLCQVGRRQARDRNWQVLGTDRGIGAILRACRGLVAGCIGQTRHDGHRPGFRNRATDERAHLPKAADGGR